MEDDLNVRNKPHFFVESNKLLPQNQRIQIFTLVAFPLFYIEYNINTKNFEFLK